MVKCIFCGSEAHSHQGVHVLNNDGSISFFCSSKCRKSSLNLKRDKRNFKWTEAYRVARAKDAQKAAAAAKITKKN